MFTGSAIAKGGVTSTKCAKSAAPYNVCSHVSPYRTDLGKCTHQCDKTQGNNSAQVPLMKTVFFGSSGARRETENERRRKQRRGQTRRS